MPPGAGLISAGLALVAGSALQLRQAALWPAAAYGAVALVGLSLLLGTSLWRRGSREVAWAALVLACAALAFASAGLRAGVRLHDALPAALEGRDLVVTGTVAGLPQRTPIAWRFVLDVESARLDDEPVDLPARLALGWYAHGGAPLPALRAGQRWQLLLRLKRPHGLANEHGFDYELHLFERGVRATGYVRTTRDARNERLDERAGHPVDRARQAVRDAIDAKVTDPGTAGVLAALAVGDQAAIDREDWALYRDTGVGHLMSISGIHVTMFAWLAGGAGAWLWRRSRWATLRCPAPTAGRWLGLLAALAYAVLAGWGVPAQRTVLMLATTTLILGAGLRWHWPLVWMAAAAAVSVADPWALLQPGFWLSFVAVGLLLASGEARAVVRAASGLDGQDGDAAAWHRPGQDGDTAARHGPTQDGDAAVRQAPAQDAAAAARDAWRFDLRWCRVGRLRTLGARTSSALASCLRTQAVATLGLAPLSLVFFQQLSLVGFVANLAAIPLVTVLITPLALLGVLLPPLWPLAALLVGALDALLQALAGWPGAVWSSAAAAPWAVLCGLAGGALALLPLPGRVRLLALPLLLPLLLPAVPRPAARAFELTAVDVGQGTAVLVRTAQHSLLYDAGPQYSAESDAGERVLLPWLRARGERRLDLLVLSHRDTDHVGGAGAVLDALPVAALSSSLEPSHPLLALAGSRGARVAGCREGQRWTWDGVAFEMLHPDPAAFERAAARRDKPNSASCVLRITGHWGGAERRVLLAGDVERTQEARLVHAYGAGLASDVLLVPHHGSKTSSSVPFLDAVAPRVAVVQAGYRNRFGHPAAEVVSRYQRREVQVVATARCGAWHYGPEGEGCRRDAARRYWHHPDATAWPGPAGASALAARQAD